MGLLPRIPDNLFRFLVLIVTLMVLWLLIHPGQVINRSQYEDRETKEAKQDKTVSYVIDPAVEAILTEDQFSGLLIDIVTRPTYTCSDVRRMGVPLPADGGYNVCMDISINPNRCIVYSFGIAQKWSFDDDMGDYGCNVYSFDPFNGLLEHQRSDRVWFYDIGLCDEDNDSHLHHLKDVDIKCRTLESVRNMLNHEKRDIDVLKIDIEGDELTCLPQIMSSGVLSHVKQLIFELHAKKLLTQFKSTASYVFKLMRRLRHDYGFQLWSVHENEMVPIVTYGPYAGNHSRCFELSWINTRFLKVDTQTEE